MKSQLVMGPFRGAITSLDPRHIPEQFAGDQSNCRQAEDGRLRPRYGFKNLRAAQGGFTNCYGLEYVQGYNAALALVEEYISFENLGAGVAAYARNASTGVPAAITGAGGLHASDWCGAPFDDTAYLVNPNETVSIKKHLIGDITSWKSVGPPASPATDLSFDVTYGGQSTPYSQLDWAGIDPTNAAEVAMTGVAQNAGSSLTAGNSMVINNSGVGDGSFEPDLSTGTAGVQDWFANDCFAFTLSTPPTSQFRLDMGSIALLLTNDDGATFVPDRFLVVSPNAWTVHVYAYFNNKTRADWGNGGGTGKVKKWKVSYKATASSLITGAKTVTISKPFIGAVLVSDPWSGGIFTGYSNSVGAVLGYSYYNSVDDFESGIGGVIAIPRSQISGYDPLGNFYYLGVHLTVTFTVSGDAAVDNYRLYYFGLDAKWHRVATVSDAGTTYLYRTTQWEAEALPEYRVRPFRSSKCINVFAYRGSLVYLYAGGAENICYSAIGNPEQQFSEFDDPTDDQAGANFSLADNFGDEPLCGFDVGGAAVILGSHGCYAQIGQIPVEMGPLFKLPGSFGVANKFAAARWKDESGNYGVVFLTATGGLYFALVSDAFNGETGYSLIEISAGVRPSLRDFLLTPQGLTDFSTARIGVDENEDAVWIIVGNRAMVLRKPSIIDNVRGWEFYRYTTASFASFKYVAFSTLRRMRWIRSDGKFDENEWDSSAGAFITGATRDGGSAMPAGSIWWKSKVFTGPEVRIHELRREGDSYTDLLQVEITSSRKVTTKTWASGKKNLRLGPLTKGREHQFRFILSDTFSPIGRIEAELYRSGSKRLRE